MPSHFAYKSGPAAVHNSPALSKRNGSTNMSVPGMTRRSSTSPLVAGGSQQSASTVSSGSRYSPDHYQAVAGPPSNSLVEAGEVSDSESHEYAYAYHNPMENVRSTGVPSASQDIAYPRLNGYLRPFNSHHNYQGPKSLNPISNGSYDAQQSAPRSLTSHLLPNGSCFVERAGHSSLGNTQPTESPRVVVNKTFSPASLYDAARNCNRAFGLHSEGFGVDGDDEDDSSSDEDHRVALKNDHNDTESSLYAEAHAYNPHPSVHLQSYQ